MTNVEPITGFQTSCLTYFTVSAGLCFFTLLENKFTSAKNMAIIFLWPVVGTILIIKGVLEVLKE